MIAVAAGGAIVRAQDASPFARVQDSIVLDPRRFDDAFGGISGIDYDARHRRWLLLSDDRSEHAPARFYAIRMERSIKGHWRLGKGGRTLLRGASGLSFPVAALGREAADPEALRVEPDGKGLVWASEGDAQGGFGPVIRRMDRKGRERAQVRLPANLRFDPVGRRGPRGNASIEGIAFSPDNALWVAMEGPMIEDGLPAAVGRAALVRFTRVGRNGDVAQFAYPVDAAPPALSGQVADNGVSEILAFDDRRMLVLERSGAVLGKGRYLFRCRLYLADFTQATAVARLVSLASAAIVPASKRLLLDSRALPDNPGNLEAMAWWPSRQGGPNRLILLNDNNFAAGEPTRLLLVALPEDLKRSAR